MKFNEKLIKLRKEKGMTQEDLAFEVGVSRQSVSKWEIGDCEPDISKLKEIGKIFNVSIDYLLNDEDEQKETQNKSCADTGIIRKEKNNKLLSAILILIGGIGLIVSFVLVFLFPHLSPSCGGKGASIIKYLILDWCSTAVLWRFCLFIPSVICVIVSFFLFKKERKNDFEEKNN